MRKNILILLLLTCSLASRANHITGGEMYYTFLSQSGSDYTYRVTLKLYRSCFSTGAPLDAQAAISIFKKGSQQAVQNLVVRLDHIDNLNLTTPGPCISNPPAVCYQAGYYIFDVTLPASPDGYIIAYQRCCRILGINNLVGSASVGATYSAEIPGFITRPDGPMNSSAQFVAPDTVIVCANSNFSYSFAAVDPDASDVLSYSFCTAYDGGTPTEPAPAPPSAPPYVPVPYSGGFSASAPLGPSITIDPATGLLTGISPSEGKYVVTVCVTETRGGVVIATQRKDIQIEVSQCEQAGANLAPQYISCDGYSWTFQNGGSQSLIHSYHWYFGDPASGTNDSSDLATPTHVFTDTGIYNVMLVVNRDGDCPDTGYTKMKVYPGFFPGFISSGTCYLKPVQFTDTSHVKYGVIDSWNWNFGDNTTLADTSHLTSPQWTYASPGPKTINFIVTSSKGCIDTITRDISLVDKPQLSLAFRDSLICLGDQVQLIASGTGNFSWTPPVNITNAGTATPTVNPPVTTVYTVQLEDGGCINTDSVKIRVVDHVSLTAMPDTTICLTDSIRLRAITDGLTFTWSPPGTLSDATLLNPIATPTGTTTYQIRAFIGSCSATDDITVTTVPYPIADAGQPVTICYNASTQLQGSHDGSSFTWTPINYLNNPGVLNPIATPPRTISYVLSSYDTKGCPKPGRDTVVVTVLPKILPFAGRDTSVIVGQPLQLNATGGVSYQWIPSTGLNNATQPNPIGTYDGSVDSVRYTVLVFNAAGCVDSTHIVVKIFKTKPSIFIPSAFTPNNDGRNDVIKPIAVGIERINYFRIYNRWGQMVFSTTVNGQGWDGTIRGVPQGTNVFVWQVSAVDYLGNPYFQKGTVTLIR